jgi:hypothetical protein
MNATPQRLAGLLALVLLVACDGGAEGSKASPTKAEPAKSGAAKTELVDEKELVEVEPKLEPAKLEPAKVEPAPVPTPEPAPEPAEVEPTPISPTPPVAEPDAADSVVAEPAPAVSSGATPISLGPDAEILKLVLARDVVNRQPVDPGTSFPSGTKVNLFIESRNEGETDHQLMVTWENVASGRRTPPVGVTIPVRKLNRTRAYRTLKLTGEHRCILLDETGKEIAVLPFTIE